MRRSRQRSDPEADLSQGRDNGFGALWPRIREADQSRASGPPPSSERRDARTARPDEEQPVPAGFPTAVEAEMKAAK
jgi:hypothetical protein